MLIKSLQRLLAAATLLVAAVSAPTQANAAAVLYTDAHVITGANSFGFTHFSVATAGLFDIYTMGPTIDPYLELFTDTGVYTDGNLLGAADDNCPFATCGPAGFFANGIITLNLAVGDYVAVVTDCCSSMRFDPGYDRGSRTDTVSIVIASDNGSVSINAVPEPGSMALVGLGLLGVAALRRRTLTK